MSNDDHGELHEIVVMPPEGCDYLDRSDGMEQDKVLEYYRLTEEGRRANELALVKILAERKGR